MRHCSEVRFGAATRVAVALMIALVGWSFAATAPARAEQASARTGSLYAGRLDSGGHHTCAVIPDGTLRCWGENLFGQLGYGNTTNIGDNESPSSAGAVDVGGSVTAVALGKKHSCAILADGSVRCWGLGVRGELGYGNPKNIGDDETPASAGAVNIGAGRTAIAITAGGEFTCAILDNGTVRCWGYNANGQLGRGNTLNIGDDETPGSVAPIDLGAGRTAVAITAGESHTCAILDNGTVRCWGLNEFGQLGYGNTTTIGDNETSGSVGTVDLGGRTATAISAAGTHTCAILDNGTVRCWGGNELGQLGYGNTVAIGDNETPGSAGPVNFGAGRTAVAIFSNYLHTCARLDDGTVRCWGWGSGGQLGYGSTANVGDNETPGSMGPVDIGAGRTALALSGGDYHTCAMLDGGAIRCWGAGANGEHGNGNTTIIGDDELPSASGTADLGSIHGVLETTSGGSHSCALFDDGTVRCWGLNSSGQLGYGNTNNIGDNENPGSGGTLDLGGRAATQVVAGDSHTCALLDNATVRCWGLNSSGQLGYGNTNNIGDNETPGSISVVNLAGEGAVALAAGGNHTCALAASGTVRCWGEGAFGQLGYGNTTTIGDNETVGSLLPVVVGRNAVSISAGGNHTCARLDDGTVRCWGLATSGQLGYANTANIGDNEAPSSAGAVSVGLNATVVASGGTHTCARLDDGTVRCWGLAASGQLGYSNTANIGDNETPSSAGAVNVGRSATGMAMGGSHSCARLDNGTVRCWGLNTFGQLGYGNTTTIGDNEAPVLAGPVNLGSGRTAANVSAGQSHACAALDNGTVRCWGLGSSGQLGYGNTESIGDNETPGSVASLDFEDDSPVAVNDAPTVTEDIATALDVLANDTDVDGGPKTIVSKTNGAHGSVVITGGGSGLTYTPDLNYCGPDSFAYELTPGGSKATVSVTVSCVDDGPVAGNDSATLAEDASATVIGVLTNDTDIDGGPKSIASKTNGAHGSVVITGGGSGLTYTPDPDYCGPDSFTYTLNGGSTATVSVTVTCVDDLPVAVNDSATLAEDSPAQAIDVLTNETDVDGGPKAIASKTNGAHGTVAITGGGAGLTYQPDPNYCGADSFTYTLNGGSTATVSITVSCVDDNPNAVADSATVLEDSGSNAIDVLTNDTDIDGGPKTIVAKTNGAHGTVAITGGGSGLTYTPDLNYCGPDSFAYELTPGGSKATVSVTVSCIDDNPNAVADSATVVEDSGPNAIDVLANDTDVDAGPMAIASKSNGAHGTVAIIGGGSGLTYTPDANYCGADSFSYMLNGGSTATVSITVSCVDDLPVAVNDSATLAEDASATAIGVLANDTDIDGGPKEVAAKANGSHGTVAITGGGTGLTYTPDPNYCGSDAFTYSLNGGSTATILVTVSCVDDSPLAVDDSASVIEDASALAINVLANDTDIDGGPKAIGAKTNGAHGSVVITGGGSGLTYTPDPDYCGPDSFTYELAPGSSQATVTLTVACDNDPPVAVNDSATLVEDAPATSIDVLSNDTDVDGGPKGLDSKANGSHGTVAITGGGTGLTYTPDANYCGPDSFTYTLNGGSQATVSVTVSCVDDPPNALGDSVTVNEDASAAPIDVLANDTDIDAGPKATVSKTDGTHGTVAITGGGSALTYTPDANYCGADSFSYTLNGGSTASVSVTITCVDDSPTAVGDSDTVAEDSSAQSIDVLANDTDIDGGLKSINGKTNGAHGTVSIIGGGSGLTYTPTSNYCGADSFTYVLNGGSQATVSVTVSCVDDAPSAIDDSATLAEDSGAKAIDVLANDNDIDGGPKAVASKANGAHGTVSIVGGGSGLNYTPDANYCGADSFTYTLNGGSQATVSITVTCVDDAPSAVDDVATVAEDAGPSAVNVLANDTDPDAGSKTISSKANGSHGTVAITGGGTGLTYTPDANYCGPDSFTYTLNGGSQATVSVTVSCVDDSPNAVADSDTVAEDSSAQAIDVLANDTDIDGGSKTITGKTNGSHGAVSIIGAGAGVTYTPEHDYCGPDSFTYTLSGGSTATVSIIVGCVDEPAPPGGGNSSNPQQGQTGSVQNVFPATTPSAPVVNVTPGVGVVSGRRHPRIAIKGSYGFFTLTCRLTERDCSGTVTITATVPSIALGPTMEKVVLVKGKFRIGAGRSVLVRAKLTNRGLEVLEDKQTLRGVASRMGIVDAVNSERGQIEVNLVRRPKASLLPGE